MRYGTDFGTNAWHADGGIGAIADPGPLLEDLVRLRGLGVEVLRWFFFADGRAGLVFDEEDAPAGVDGYVWRDVDAALSLLARAGLRLLPVLLDFHWCLPRRIVNGVRLGGRRSIISHPARRRALVDQVICPLARRYGRERRIFGWDLFNEPEWVTFGLGCWRPVSSVSPGSLRRFLAEATEAVHAEAEQPVTVGSASARWLPLVRGIGLDFYQVHWYDHLEARAPLGRPVSALGCDRPIVLGEFPTRGSRFSPAEIVATARVAGYAGAFFWSARAEDEASNIATVTPLDDTRRA